jgi:hypothetical protein
MVRIGVLLLAFVCGFVVAGLLGSHAYRGSHTGFVLSSCGPAVEITGNPRAYMEQCR